LKVVLLTVGKPGALLRDAIHEYEQRAARYWPLETIEVKEAKAGRNTPEEQVRELESERLLERVPSGTEMIALTRTGSSWDSERLAQHLKRRALESHPGVSFLIGGALGLSRTLLQRATHQMSLSACTLPHELARLMLAEQLYRAGTIARGEPYHKARA
jgi:23S rRNA (pseudouridine1915-N3)-methyltransferase